MQTYIDVDQCAKELGVSRSTLARWRLTGEGPVYHKVGRRVLYRVTAVEEWVHSHAYCSTSDYGVRVRK